MALVHTSGVYNNVRNNLKEIHKRQILKRMVVIKSVYSILLNTHFLLTPQI